MEVLFIGMIAVLIIMLMVYVALCFTSWITDVIEYKQWKYWFK